VPPDLSIVVVNWNTRDHLERCLRSIERSSSTTSSPAVEVIVVDNASSDGSQAMVRASFPSVHLIANATNLGFTAANNQGLRHARGRYLMLLNPDTEVLDDALAAMVRYLDDHPDVGVVGPRLLNPDGTAQSSRRRFPTLATTFIESTVLQRYLPNHPLLRRYYVLDRSDDETQEVDWLVGACLAVRREAVEEVGLLDEGFFMYSEELDWCRRIVGAGWKIVYLPTARVVHWGGASSERDVLHRHIYFQDSKCRYVARYHGVWASRALRLFLFGTYMFQLLEEGAKWLLGHKRPLRASRLGVLSGYLRWQMRRWLGADDR